MEALFLFINIHMASILDRLVDQQQGQRQSPGWYRNAVASLTVQPTGNRLMRDGKLQGRPSAGRLNLYMYDPKTKEKLPYYDIFPLVLPLETFRGGFLGLNFHYLPYGARFNLLQQLERYASNTKFDRTTRLDVNYGNTIPFSMVKPTIKKYLWSHVRSNFLRIDANEAAIAIYLPVQRFRKRSAQYVWSQSRKQYG